MKNIGNTMRRRSEEISEFIGYWVCANGNILERKDCSAIVPYSSGIVRLRKENNKKGTIAAHRLVALAFLERPKGCDFVKFKDGDPTNRAADNLQWVIGVRPVSEKSKEIIAMKLDGLSNVQISEVIDCTPQYVHRVLKDHQKRLDLHNEHQD